MRFYSPGAMTRRWPLLAVLALISLSTVTPAQNVYTWKDERGVLHFSDEPPPGDRKDVQVRPMSPPKPLVAGGAASETPATPQAELPATPAAESTVKAKGPARVVVTQRDVVPSGPQERHFTGSVKNVGGEPAQRVTILVDVTDADQGSPCITKEIGVAPENLDSSGEGTFDDYVDTPCFLGNAGIEISPAWD